MSIVIYFLFVKVGLSSSKYTMFLWRNYHNRLKSINSGNELSQSFHVFVASPFQSNKRHEQKQNGSNTQELC